MDLKDAIETLLLSKEVRQTHDEGLRAKILETKVVKLLTSELNNPILSNKSSLRDMLDSVDAALDFVLNDAKSNGVSFSESMIDSLADITAILHVNFENMNNAQDILIKISSNGDNDAN